MVSELIQHRRDFWRFFGERLPVLHGRMMRGNEHSRWLAVGHRPLIIAHYIANRGVGLFIRGPAREPAWRTREFLFPHRDFLADRFGDQKLKLGNMFLLPRGLRIDMTDRGNWHHATAWFAEHSPVYESVVTELQARPHDWPDALPQEL